MVYVKKIWNGASMAWLVVWMSWKEEYAKLKKENNVQINW